jgi:predicted nucleic acid-binding protein
MSGLLDTSVLVRYLMGEPRDLADRAASMIDGGDGLQVTEVVLAETAYVLSTVYGVPRESVVDNLIALLQRQNITSFGLEKDLILEALLLCRPSARVSYADALTWAAAQSTDHKVVYTLDERFPSEGLDIRR